MNQLVNDNDGACSLAYLQQKKEFRVNVPINLTKIYIESFLVHKTLVSVQEVMLE